jgi:hypothetical protein
MDFSAKEVSMRSLGRIFEGNKLFVNIEVPVVTDSVASMSFHSCSNLPNVGLIKRNSLEKPLALLVLASNWIALRIYLFVSVEVKKGWYLDRIKLTYVVECSFDAYVFEVGKAIQLSADSELR